jgi:hypothetical protein
MVFLSFFSSSFSAMLLDRRPLVSTTTCCQDVNHERSSDSPTTSRFLSLKPFEWKIACDMADSKAGTALTASAD